MEGIPNYKILMIEKGKKPYIMTRDELWHRATKNFAVKDLRAIVHFDLMHLLRQELKKEVEESMSGILTSEMSIDQNDL